MKSAQFMSYYKRKKISKTSIKRIVYSLTIVSSLTIKKSWDYFPGYILRRFSFVILKKTGPVSEIRLCLLPKLLSKIHFLLQV